MLLSKKRVGVDLSRCGIRMALLDGLSTACRLSSVQERHFPPGALTLTGKEFLITDNTTITEQIRDAYSCLKTSVNKAVVTLPDSVGRMLVIEMNERIGSRAEGMELIRWKLKKQIRDDLDDMMIDYQVLEEQENGSLSVLVALISRVVVEGCESLLTGAGLVPTRIEFNCMSLHRPFAGQLDNCGASSLISFHSGNLGIMILKEGVPRFIRNKELSGSSVTDPRLFMELKNTFVSWRKQNHNRGLDTVHTLAPPNSASRFEAMIAEATGISPIPFTIADAVPTGDLDLVDRAALYPYAAAIGAAWRTA